MAAPTPGILRIIIRCAGSVVEFAQELRRELMSDAIRVTTLTFLGFELTTHCAQIVCSNH